MPNKPITKSLPKLSLGTASMGNLYKVVSDESCMETLQLAWDSGLRYIDTAPFYGQGLSETRVGSFLADKNPDDYILSTKVGRILVPEVGESPHEKNCYVQGLPFDPVYDYTYDAIYKSVEDSFERLGRRKIDIAYVHDIGTLTHGDDNAKHMKDLLDGGIKALEELKSDGVIHAYGLGVNEKEICMDVLTHTDVDVFLLAGRYTLLEQESLDDLLPLCAQKNVDIVIGGVFNSGILVNYKTDNLMYNYAPAPQHIVDRVNGLANICDDYGVPLPAVAIQFASCHPVIQSTLVGASKSSHLQQAIHWNTIDIPHDLWAELKHNNLIKANAPTPNET